MCLLPNTNRKVRTKGASLHAKRYRMDGFCWSSVLTCKFPQCAELGWTKFMRQGPASKAFPALVLFWLQGLSVYSCCSSSSSWTSGLRDPALKPALSSLGSGMRDVSLECMFSVSARHLQHFTFGKLFEKVLKLAVQITTSPAGPGRQCY